MYLACDRRGRLSVACFGGSQAVARAGSALKRAWTLESCQPSDAANRPSSSTSLPAGVGARQPNVPWRAARCAAVEPWRRRGHVTLR